MQRQNGILMPIFSLPAEHGIGSFGNSAYRFIDFLKESKQKLWQILPLVQTGLGNSPYSSVCSYSFNPYFISVEKLKNMGLLREDEISNTDDKVINIDYGRLYTFRYPLLKKAFYRYDKNSSEFQDFLATKEYHDYALYMTIKSAFGGISLSEWGDKFKYRDKDTLNLFESIHSEEIMFWEFLQFIAKKQWLELKKYANDNGISIIGDMPLYVALDSVDVWCNPSVFLLDKELNPEKVAGVPPDYFCEKGQLWGNPIYNYDEQKKDNFKWWTNRLEKVLEIYDYVRIDHFRGLDRFYAIGSKEPDATNGEWIKVPSEELFTAIHKKIDKSRIIAEDLGTLDDGVIKLIESLNYPGMKVLSFAFNGDSNNIYLPENVKENAVMYTGTHDNDTLMGLIDSLSDEQLDNMKKQVQNSLDKLKISLNVEDKKSLFDAIVELSFASMAKINILPIFDLLSLGTEYRINVPGVVKKENWSVIMPNSIFDSDNIKKLKKLTIKYNR